MAQIEVDLPEHTLVPLMRLHDSRPAAGRPARPGGLATPPGRAIRSLPLPAQTLITLVVGADGTPQVPSGDTVLRVGDEVIAVIPHASRAASCGALDQRAAPGRGS